MVYEREFFAHLVSRGLAENTVTSYRNDLSDFFGRVGKSAQKITRLDIQRYFVEIMGLGISARTCGRRLATLRTYYGFLLDMEEVERSPTKGIIAPKQPRRLQRAVSQDDLETMVNSLGDSPQDVRNKALLLTLYASGLRASELLNLKLPDLDLDRQVIRVWDGKGSKDGIAPLNPRAVEALRKYLVTFTPSPQVKVFPFSRQRLWKIVRKLSGDTSSPHRIRAGCATALLKGGADIRTTQVVLRHASIDTTQLYLDIDPEYMREAYFKFHPRATRLTGDAVKK